MRIQGLLSNLSRFNNPITSLFFCRPTTTTIATATTTAGSEGISSQQITASGSAAPGQGITTNRPPHISTTDYNLLLPPARRPRWPLSTAGTSISATSAVVRFRRSGYSSRSHRIPCLFDKQICTFCSGRRPLVCNLRVLRRKLRRRHRDIFRLRLYRRLRFATVRQLLRCRYDHSIRFRLHRLTPFCLLGSFPFLLCDRCTFSVPHTGL